MKQLANEQLADQAVERVRRNHAECILELQGVPMARARVILGVQLEDGVAKSISHRLGRAPLYVRESCPRGATTAGVVIEVLDSTVDRAKQVTLKASGFGATITVDVLVA